jgi:hypothetical protein
MLYRWSLYKTSTVVLALLITSMYYSADVQAASLRVVWEDTSSNEDGFKIERLVGGIIDATMTVGSNANSYTDNGLTAGTVYCYRVLAFNGAGNSSPSNQPCATATEGSVASSTTNLTVSAAVVGGILTFTWSGISSPTATDWAGIYSPGAANPSSHYWMYLSCSQTAGTPQSSGSCSYPLPQTFATGTYELRLFSNDGFAPLGTPVAFSLTSMNIAKATLTASPAKVSAGSTITAAWSAISLPSATDWIGLYTSGAADVNFLSWMYVNCLSTASIAQTSGSCPYVLPKSATAGTHELRLFTNNSYTRIGSTTFEIIGSPTAPGNLIVRFQ